MSRCSASTASINNRATQTEAALLLGVKAPTGRTKRHDSARRALRGRVPAGQRLLGRPVRAGLTQRFGAWSFDANVLYQLVNKGAQDTDLGDRFLYNAAVSYRLTGEHRGHRRAA